MPALIHRRKCSITGTAAFCRTCCVRSWLGRGNDTSVFLIANAAAGFGRAAGLIPAARAALERVGGATLVATEARGHEAQCTRQAIEQGATTIAVLGGDGTVSQVACELVRLKSTVPLAIFGAGTGNDFAKSLSAPIHDFRAMAQLIESQRVETIDAACVDDAVFINSAGFGFDAEVVRRTKNPRWLRGKVVYGAASLRQLVQYQGFAATISHAVPSLSPASEADETNAKRTVEGRWLTLVFANGGWFGGGFRIAPGSSISDGVLDAVCISDAGPVRRAAIFARAMSGRHVNAPEVRTARAGRFTLEFAAPPWYQADGELHQAASKTVEIKILPAALRVVA